MTGLDGATLAVLLIALVRGVYIGLIREGFSMAALAAAVLVARVATQPSADWLVAASDGQIGALVAPWITGALIGIATVMAVGLVGRLLRRGLHAAGLSWADRLGGAAIGLAEGAIVAAIIILGATWILGRDHPTVAESRSLAAYDDVQHYVAERAQDLPELPDVAAPGWRE